MCIEACGFNRILGQIFTFLISPMGLQSSAEGHLRERNWPEYRPSFGQI